MSLLVDVLWLGGAIAVIILACEAFTNAIEWLGSKLDLSQGAVGSVLAAVGTALPETVMPLIAIASAWGDRRSSGAAIGLGAIVGAPFMLSTLAMGVTGAAIIVFVRQGWRDEHVDIDPMVMKRDLRYFLITYGLMVAASFVPSHPFKVALGFGLLAVYGLYVYRTLQQPGDLGEDLAPLYFARGHEVPGMPVVILQVVLSLLGIVFGAHVFVDHLAHMSLAIGLPPLILSLILAPIATELPEKFNSVIWVRARKDTLALGNITGAMVFQSCIPVAVGLWMTPWVLGPSTLLSAGVALLAAALLYLRLKFKQRITPFELLFGGGLYAACLIGLFAFHL